MSEQRMAEQVRMSLEPAVSILHADGSENWSSDADPETTASPGSILNDQAVLGKNALLAPRGEGSRKSDLTKARVSFPPQLANHDQRASFHAVKNQ